MQMNISLKDQKSQKIQQSDDIRPLTCRIQSSKQALKPDSIPQNKLKRIPSQKHEIKLPFKIERRSRQNEIDNEYQKMIKKSSYEYVIPTE